MFDISNVQRKRHRSDDCDYSYQVKYFINDRMIEKRNEKQMKVIHDKTIKLLYDGAQNINNSKEKQMNNNVNKMKISCRNVRLFGNNEIIYLNEDVKTSGTENCSENSKCCDKPSQLKGDCINCNLELCEFCGLSCNYCNDPLCMSCINLFGCGTAEIPCCGPCKLYVKQGS